MGILERNNPHSSFADNHFYQLSLSDGGTVQKEYTWCGQLSFIGTPPHILLFSFGVIASHYQGVKPGKPIHWRKVTISQVIGHVSPQTMSAHPGLADFTVGRRSLRNRVSDNRELWRIMVLRYCILSTNTTSLEIHFPTVVTTTVSPATGAGWAFIIWYDVLWYGGCNPEWNVLGPRQYKFSCNAAIYYTPVC